MKMTKKNDATFNKEALLKFLIALCQAKPLLSPILILEA